RLRPRWTLTRANGPMGGVVAAAGDVLALVRVHLDGGHTPDGTDVLPPAVVEAMQRPQVDTPLPGESQAIGWTVLDGDGTAVLARDANTFGQQAFLRVVPAHGIAVCLLTNSPTGGLLARDLLPRVLADLAEVAVPPLLSASTVGTGAPGGDSSATAAATSDVVG